LGGCGKEFYYVTIIYWVCDQSKCSFIYTINCIISCKLWSSLGPQDIYCWPFLYFCEYHWYK